jgi:phage repressor protein C with HTH and peptisase S24 domain
LEEKAAKEREEALTRQRELEAENKRLADEQKRREDAERERLEAENKKREEEAQLAINLNQQSKQTEVLFDMEASITGSTQAPEARQGYEIIVSHTIGYGQIFQFYFEKEGKNQPIDKLGNMKLDQMKAYCEKLAHKTGEMIESKYLKYEPSFKAINRK